MRHCHSHNKNITIICPSLDTIPSFKYPSKTVRNRRCNSGCWLTIIIPSRVTCFTECISGEGPPLKRKIASIFKERCLQYSGLSCSVAIVASSQDQQKILSTCSPSTSSSTTLCNISTYLLHYTAARWRSWLRHCAKSRKVAGFDFRRPHRGFSLTLSFPAALRPLGRISR